MNILWASPFNTHSAIARFSLEVCTELVAHGHRVDLLRIEIGESLAMPARDACFPILQKLGSLDLGRYDLVVVNLGNHAPYHAGALELFDRCIPLLIFHDAEMRDFAWGVAHFLGLDVGPLVTGSALEANEDTLIAKPARDHLAFYASMACGAIVHGPHYFHTIAQACPGPVAVSLLSYPDIGAKVGAVEWGPTKRVVVFGDINANKQVDRILRAGILLRDAHPIHLVLVGRIADEDRERYTRQALEAGLIEPRYCGFVTDEVLCAEIANADVICCLRYPVSEGGSASLVTALYSGRPVIVSNVGSYALVPDNMITKVTYGEDEHDLAEAMRGLFTDRAKAEEMASRARTWAIEAYSARGYVDRLLPVAIETMRIFPWIRTARSMAIKTGIVKPDGFINDTRALNKALVELTQR